MMEELPAQVRILGLSCHATLYRQDEVVATCGKDSILYRLFLRHQKMIDD